MSLVFVNIFIFEQVFQNPLYDVYGLSLKENKQLSAESTNPNILSDMILTQLKQKIVNITSNPVPGISFVVGVITSNGSQVSSYGNISESNPTKVDGNTIFDIASVTKTFTSVLLMDLVKQRLINLEDPLEKILFSNISVPSYEGHKITLENLATHTSGLPWFPTGWERNQSYTNQQAYDMFSNTSLEYEPGTKTMYSNIGAGMLGNALEIATGKSYDQLLKTRIFDVLGMKDSGIGMNATSISIPDDIKQKFAKGHIGEKEVNLEYLPPQVQPSGAIYSTVNDLIKYLSANIGLIDTTLNDAMKYTHLIRYQFEDSSTGNFEDPSGHKSAVFDYIGLGWFVETNFGQQIVWHNGGIDGFSSWLGFNPDKQVGVVILCSCDSRDVPPGEMISVATPFLLFYPNH